MLLSLTASIGPCGIEMPGVQPFDSRLSAYAANTVELKCLVFNPALKDFQASIGPCGIEIWLRDCSATQPIALQSDLVELKWTGWPPTAGRACRFNRTLWN